MFSHFKITFEFQYSYQESRTLFVTYTYMLYSEMKVAMLTELCKNNNKKINKKVI